MKHLANRPEMLGKDNKLGRKRVGEIGESAAVIYLASKGHKILGRNIRLKRGEIDILTIKDNVLHVVEVKTSQISGQNSTPSILPEENFSQQKINRLKYLSGAILLKYSKGDLAQAMNQTNQEIHGKNISLKQNTDIQCVQIDGVAIRIYNYSANINKHTKNKPSLNMPSKITARYYPGIS